MKRYLAAVLCLILLCPALALAETGVCVTDMMGREIALPQPATRVVALTASECEILYALGAGDALVGRGEYCDYPAAVTDVPSVQSGYETNIEQIIALSPDLLFMSAMAQPKEQVDALEAAGIPVAVADADEIEDVYTAIALVGALMGKDAEASALVDSMRQTFADIAEASVGAGRTIYFEVSPLAYGLWTAGRGTFMDEIAGLLGLVNCFADVEGWAEISEEQVIERNPDFIVTIAMYAGEGQTPIEEICARPGWSGIEAVQRGAILNLQDNELSRPAPRLVDGALAMAAWIEAAD